MWTSKPSSEGANRRGWLSEMICPLDLTLRSVQARDLPAIYEIEKISFKEPYPPSFIDTLAYRNPEMFVVAEENGRIVGYVVAMLQGESLGRIVSIAVSPNRRRRGVGSALTLRILEVLKRLGAESVRLEVRRSNIAAQRFYEKLGFKKACVIKNYYRDEDAYVFVTALENVRKQSLQTLKEQG